MVLTTKEDWQIKNDILQNMTFTVSNIEGTYTYDIAQSTALSISDVYKYTEEFFPQLFPWSATEDLYVDYHMKTFGLIRRGAVAATGEVTFTGVPDTTIQKDTIVISRLGIKYKTLESCLIPTGGECTAKIECLQTGTVGNCGIGDIVTLEIVIPNVYSVTNKAKIDTGYEKESLESCYERMKFKASKPSHSGNKNDYEGWAKSVEGVGKVTVFGAGESGVTAGNVKVIISDYNLAPANSDLVDKVKAYIEDDRRPVGANVTVVSFTAKDFTVKVNVKVESGINIDDVKTKFEASIKENLKDENFTKDGIISLGKIGNLLFSIPGALDYRNLLLNDAGNSIVITSEEVANLTSVEVTQWT